MSTAGSQPPERVPTLTEVVAWPETQSAQVLPEPISQHGALEADVIERAPAGANAPAPLARISEEQIVDRVMADLQRQIDLMLEQRLREILTPILTRAADSVIRDARGELASTLRDVVARAVAQELTRHRTR